jgi:predicted dehydrogenase
VAQATLKAASGRGIRGEALVQPIRIGIVGVGKIARDAHVPSISANPAFVLAATASPRGELPGVVSFASLESMLDGVPELAAVALCTPPQVRYEAARLALERGKHVLLEKPPCPSVAGLEHLSALAQTTGRTLYQTWHSQEAPAVARAVRELSGRTLERVRVTWQEDVREWHPGQRWLWEAGGFGVFDAGINALSILTRIIPEPLLARSAHFHVPANCATPIAAELTLATASGVPIEATFDFRHPGTPRWEIEISTDRGPLTLADGGATLRLEGARAVTPRVSLGGEYAAIYRRFYELIARGESEVDARPLHCVADLYLLATHVTVEAFAG